MFSGAQPSLRFGISRSHGGLQLVESANRFAACLAGSIGRKVTVVIAGDYDHLLGALLVGGIDLAWMPPLVHTRAAEGGAELAAVSLRSGALGYRSAIVVREGTPFRKLLELKGRRAAWVDPSSVSGYLFPRLYLLAAGIRPLDDLASEKFYGSTAQACAAVSEDEADFSACFVSEGAAEDSGRALTEVRRAVGAAGGKLRVLFVTDPIPPDGMVLAAPLDAGERRNLRQALVTLHEWPGGQEALWGLMQADRLSPINEEVQRVLSGLRALT